MDKEFKEFLEKITLSQNQEDDAKTKYNGVCEKLYSKYYSGKYDYNKQLLFGSYKTKTNVRPLTSDQDVDVLFKIPKETFDRFDSYGTNGQEALLQEIRNVLKEKYTTTNKIKAWTKVVLVEFTDGHHNVELLPGFELEDGTFKIPTSSDGGCWEIFDPRTELDRFDGSNRATAGLTRELAKMLKAWGHKTSSMDYKSYKRLNDIIAFINDYYPAGRQSQTYSRVVFEFFDYLISRCDNSIKSFVTTARNRSQKALEFEDNDRPKEASDEWRKIFGDEFPKVEDNPQTDNRHFTISPNPVRPWSY